MARLTANGIDFDLLDPNNKINSFYWQYPAGTKKVFYQAAAPVKWTQDTSSNNRALRVVNSAGGGTGGVQNWTTVLKSTASLAVALSGTFPVTGSVGNHTLSLSQLPDHTHPSLFGPAGGAGSTPFSNTGVRLTSGTNATGTMVPAGGGSVHNHPWSGSVVVDENTDLVVDLGVQYIDVIVCSLN